MVLESYRITIEAKPWSYNFIRKDFLEGDIVVFIISSM